MRFILFCLALGLGFSAFSQPSSSDYSFRLLWFKGKKLGANSLTTRAGDTVFYQPVKNDLKYSAKKGSSNRLAVVQAELARTPQRTKEMLARLAAALPKQFSPYLSQPVQEAFAKVNSELKDAVSNVYELPPLPPVAKRTTTTEKGGPSYSELNETADFDLDAFIEEVKAFHQKLAQQKITWVPTPPRVDLGYCAECDEFNKARIEKETEEFERQFWVAEEKDFFQKVLTVARQLQLTGSEEEWKKFEKVYDPFFDLLEDRFMQRARMLLDQYLDKPEYYEAMLPTVFSIERQRQLMGRAASDKESLIDGLFEKMFPVLDAYLAKAAAEFNYPVMLNARFILGAERQKQLLGTAKGLDLFQRYIDFNRFKLSINVNSRMGGVDKWGNYAYVVSQLRGDNYFSVVPNEGCKLEWVLMGPDKDKLKFKLEAGEIISTIPVTYNGTKDWFTEKPTLNLDFCATDPDDTVITRAFTPVGLHETWIYPAPIGEQHYPNIAGAIAMCFIDKDRLMEESKQLNEEKLAQIKKEMMAKYNQFMQNSKGLRGKDPSKMTPAEMAKMATAMQAAEKMMADVQMPVAVGSFLVKTKAVNRSKIIFKEKLDGRELFPDNPAIQYAYFHIQLEQDPGSPYKVY